MRAYAGETAALLTRHGKVEVLGPLFEAHLGCHLRVTSAFDTDRLGTFTRDVPRVGTQLEAARKKAAIARDLCGVPLGVGSEGTLQPGPFGFGAWSVEIVCFTDGARGIEVVGRAHGPVPHVLGEAHSFEEALRIAEQGGFPEHAVVVTGEGPPCKGIRSEAALREAARGSSFWVETDMRAHVHPTRMAIVAEAGLDLVHRLATACPSCGLPGFGVDGLVPGARCRACGGRTEEPAADVHACVACRFRTVKNRADAWVPPERCPRCNP